MPTTRNAFIREIAITAALCFASVLPAVAAEANVMERGTVTGGGQPVAGATAQLWAAKGNESPSKIAQSVTGRMEAFLLHGRRAPGAQILYILAWRGHSRADADPRSNPAIVVVSILGANPPSHVVVNELTTIASSMGWPSRFVHHLSGPCGRYEENR